MLCPKCGKAVGEQMALCEDCTAMEGGDPIPPADTEAEAAAPSEDAAPDNGSSIVDEASSIVDIAGEPGLDDLVDIPEAEPDDGSGFQMWGLGVLIGVIVLLIGVLLVLYLMEDSPEPEETGDSAAGVQTDYPSSSNQGAADTSGEQPMQIQLPPMRKSISQTVSTTTMPPPLFEAIPAGALGFAESTKHNVFFKEAVAIFNPRYNYVEIGFFERALSDKLRTQIRSRGRFATLRDAGPNITLLLNFGSREKGIVTDNIDGFSVNFHRRSSSAFNFFGSADIASFRRSLFEMGENDAMEVSGSLDGPQPSIMIKSQGIVEHRRTQEKFKWKVEAKAEIIKAKKRKASKVKQ